MELRRNIYLGYIRGCKCFACFHSFVYLIYSYRMSFLGGSRACMYVSQLLIHLRLKVICCFVYQRIQIRRTRKQYVPPSSPDNLILMGALPSPSLFPAQSLSSPSYSILSVSRLLERLNGTCRACGQQPSKDLRILHRNSLWRFLWPNSWKVKDFTMIWNHESS